VVFYLVFKLLCQYIDSELKSAKGRKIYKIGVEFDKEMRNIGRWITEEGP